MYKNLIFDLDGTLLDTLVDIRAAINLALKQCGYDYSFSLKESRTLIGNGSDMLVKRALKNKGDDETACLKSFGALDLLDLFPIFTGADVVPPFSTATSCMSFTKVGLSANKSSSSFIPFSNF